jgi:flagellar assembly protein FliH
MSTVIKASELGHGVGRVAFNFDDMTAKAQQYLDGVRAEAGQIVAKAQQEAAAIRKRAETEGRRAAEQKVEQMTQQHLASKLATLLPALRQAVADVGHARQAWLTHWERSGVRVAAAIAERILRRELTRQPDIPVALVREALELAAGSSQVRIHLHPDDYQTLAGQIETLATEFAPMGRCELIADAEISAGGCRVETRFGVIDQQFEAQLARIQEELT